VFQFSSRSVRSSGFMLRLALCGAASLLPQVCLAQDSILVGDFNGSKIVRLAYPSGTAQSHFVATGMTALANTEGMTFGPDGNLYFSSYGGNAIIRVDGRTGFPSGATSTFVTPGVGGLSHPFGLAFGPDGRLYVASFSTNQVLVYDGTTGAFISAFVLAGAGTLTGPTGIAFFNGSLYVCSNANAKVLRFDGTTGAFIEETITQGQSGLTAPRGILFDTGGRMYVTGGNLILVKDPVAGVSVLASSTTIPALIAPEQPNLAADGSLMVPCHNGTVQRLDRVSGSSLGTLVLNGAGGMTTVIESVLYLPAPVTCYPNCDNSTQQPILNVLDFTCFLQKFAAGCP
jgi:outer membrane protein assembly factor BamB